MLSRTADHLFWMARYTERAENTARILFKGRAEAACPVVKPLQANGAGGPKKAAPKRQTANECSRRCVQPLKR